MFNLQKMYTMQKGLNDHIITQHNLHGHNLFEERVLALLVELGELANETRCFKYWSLKGPSKRSVILEEYVDGVHFILSLGLDMKINQDREIIDVLPTDKNKTQLFNDIFGIVQELRVNNTKDNYYMLIDMYFALGKILGFSKEDIYQAYIEKNKVNHERQENNY